MFVGTPSCSRLVVGDNYLVRSGVIRDRCTCMPALTCSEVGSMEERVTNREGKVD